MVLVKRAVFFCSVWMGLKFNGSPLLLDIVCWEWDRLPCWSPRGRQVLHSQVNMRNPLLTGDEARNWVDRASVLKTGQMSIGVKNRDISVPSHPTPKGLMFSKKTLLCAVRCYLLDERGEEDFVELICSLHWVDGRDDVDGFTVFITLCT